MSLFALGLVLVAAVLHAGWNVLAKRAQGGIAFIWITFVLSIAFYLPFVIAVSLAMRPRLDATAWGFIAGNGALHVIYFVLLQRGYRAGDLSLVYPLARGTGPLISSLAAMVLFGERPGPVALAGIALIVGGILLGSARGGLSKDERSIGLSVAYGTGTGIAIAAYTLWDKYSVGTLALVPIVYDFWGNVVRAIVLAPWMIGRGAELRAAWRANRIEATGIALLSPLAYLLVLWALVFTPVSAVAPAREISIVIGAVLGVRLFGETAGARRIAASIVMLLGIVALAAG